jgi:hypothetical protein
MLEGVLKSDSGVKILSVLWGLGISCLFQKVCNGRNCIIMKAPDPTVINGKVYQFDGKCYQFVPYNSKCNENAINM